MKVPRGRYVIEGIGIASGRYRFVSRLRVRLETAKNPKLGRKLGDTGTDSAMIGVCDNKAFDKVRGRAADDDFQKAIEAQTRRGFGVIAVKEHPAAVMPFVPTGSDGTGPVFALMSGAKRVGIELPFMGENEERQESNSKQDSVSLLGTDSDHFITRRMDDGTEASFWIGGELRAGIQFYLWSSASRGPVNYQIRRASGSVLKGWTPMSEGRGGGRTQFSAPERLKAGQYEFDFRIGERVFSALKLTLA